MERSHGRDFQAVSGAPIKKLPASSGVRSAGVPVPDSGREEFNIGIGGPGAGCGNQLGDPIGSRTTGNDTAEMGVVDG
jgi:hypothetical protein